jgi:arylsulfatase A-like enzyme
MLSLLVCACADPDATEPSVPRVTHARSATTQPNIVFILTDDQRAGTMQYMPMTSSIFSTSSVTFTNAFSTTPLCCPARASILSGLWTHNHGVLSNIAPFGAPAFQDVSTLATWLDGAGYRTALVGKYLNLYDQLTPWPYLPPGWDEWRVFKSPGYYNYRLVENGTERAYGGQAQHYATRVLGQQAVTFIDSAPAGEPIFLFFSPPAPHSPATPANTDKALFSNLPRHRPPSFNEANVSDKPNWVRRLPVMTSARVAATDKLRLNMLRSLQAVDRQIQNIWDALIRTGRADNTILVFASDNGFAWGEHRYTWKDCVYEECIKVPLMVRAPGLVTRTDSNLVALVDLPATFVEYAGAASPVLNGTSLVPLLGNPLAPWRQELLLEVLHPDANLKGEGVFSGVRTHQYTYAEHATGERELYDLAADPHQLANVVNLPGNGTLVQQLSAVVAALKAE